MAVRANLIVGAVGAVLALSSGSYIAVNWESLVGLETWEASFDSHNMRLPDRGGALAGGQNRNEVYDVAFANATRIQVDVTWVDPAFNSPSVQVRLVDPKRQVRAEETHRGGGTGVHFLLQLIPSDEIPDEPALFRVRHDPQDLNARQGFEARWPTHTENQGNWTVELRSIAGAGPAPTGSITYTVRVEYDYYAGTYQRLPTTGR